MKGFGHLIHLQSRLISNLPADLTRPVKLLYIIGAQVWRVVDCFCKNHSTLTLQVRVAAIEAEIAAAEQLVADLRQMASAAQGHEVLQQN